MPIKEESFRIGSGRYIQGKGYINRIGAEINRLGSRPLIIGGKTALSKTRDNLEDSLRRNCNFYEIIVHAGTCDEAKAKELASFATEKNYDVIVGVGGGVICDFAKLCAHFAKLPIINLPTSSATCAAYTPLSIRYTPDGRTVGSLHYGYEIDGVVADTQIIATQPTRLLLSGVFDALAKFVEIKQRYTEETTDYPLGLDYAYVMSKYSFDFLSRKTQKCIDDIEKGEITADVENVIFTSIAATGVISGIARGSNQAALAHKFYYVARLLFPEDTKPFLHGEIVGIGLLLQNHFNGEEENNLFLLELMKKHNMPYRVSDINIPKTQEVFNAFVENICDGVVIENDNEAAKLKESLKYLWEIK